MENIKKRIKTWEEKKKMMMITTKKNGKIMFPEHADKHSCRLASQNVQSCFEFKARYYCPNIL